ncbi:MAG: hypothetical protein RL071_3161 [Pseudomonadota bacterium]
MAPPLSPPPPNFALRRAVALLVLGALVFGALELSWRLYAPRLDPALAALRAHRPAQQVVLLDRHGEPFDQISDERRIWRPLSAIPEVMVDAVLAAEDRRFWRHKGIDLTAILRAARANLRAGAVVQGGSTISQQLIKNLVVGGDRTLWRKAEEALLALRLGDHFTKEQQLELYLNLVYLGGGNHGIEAASRDWFGHPADTLSLGEAALIAGLIRAPSRDDPRSAPDRARVARDRVLFAMRDAGLADADEVDRAANDPLQLAPLQAELQSPHVAYQTAARAELLRLYDGALPWSEALVVRTALDPALQAAAEAAVEAAARAVERRNGVLAVIFDINPEELARRSARAGVPVRQGACFEARVEGGRRGPRLVAGDWSGQLGPADLRLRARPRADGRAGTVDDELQRAARVGGLVPVCLDAQLRPRLDRRPWVQGAAVVIEVSTGAVRAATAGRGHTLMGFHRGTQARRQPGSAFKPFVYAAALEAGLTQLDPVVDGPLRVPGPPGKPDWQPRNFSPGFSGTVPLRVALARSLNTPAVRLTQRVGPEKVIEVARDLGVQSPLRADLALSLGASELTVLELAAAGANLARLGRVRAPVFIEQLEHRGRCCAQPGDPLPGHPAGTAAPGLPGAPGPRVVQGATARQVLEMMQRAVSAGTATAARRPGEVLAAKTGTTSDFLDAWFLAIRPDHVVAVWIGADDHLPLGPDETGAEAALPAARAILDQIPAPPGDFGVPDDVVLIPEGGWTLSLPRGTPDALRRLRQARPVAPPPPAAGVEGAESAAGAEGAPPSTSGEDVPLDDAPIEEQPAPASPEATLSP